MEQKKAQAPENMKRVVIYVRPDHWKLVEKSARESFSSNSEIVREAIDQMYGLDV